MPRGIVILFFFFTSTLFFVLNSSGSDLYFVTQYKNQGIVYYVKSISCFLLHILSRRPENHINRTSRRKGKNSSKIPMIILIKNPESQYFKQKFKKENWR